MKLPAFVLMLLLLTACGGSKETRQEFRLSGEYTLVSLQGEDVSTEGLSFTFDPSEDRIYGETGCNGFSANFLQKESKILINQALSTRKYCEGRMDIENSILQALERVVSVRQQGKDLVLYSTEGSSLFTLNKKP